MRKVLILLLSALSLTAFANNAVKVVAILPTVDVEGNVGYGVKFQLRASLTYAINMTSGYMGVDRVDMSSIMNEQSFQRTGAVNNDQIKKLGAMAGAQYVLIAEAALYDEKNIIIAAKILDVETGGLVNSTPPSIAGKDPEKMQAACVKVAKTLLGVSGSTGGVGVSSYSPPHGFTHQNFTEEVLGINMKMIWVEGDDFLMGCTSEQGSDCDGREKNVRRVTMNGFYIGQFEVTQSQWEKVVGTSIYQQRDKASIDYPISLRLFGTGANYPMYYVSWEEAMEFCRLLSNKTGKTYTLPTEAQWEYAARGGNMPDGTKYSGSNMIDVVAWYYDNSGNCVTCGGDTHPVGTKRGNSLDIYNMSGNVSEWCRDWYSSNYTSYDTNNPAGPSSGSYRVVRGGSSGGDSNACRVACRDYYSPGNRDGQLGFRIVCIP